MNSVHQLLRKNRKYLNKSEAIFVFDRPKKHKLGRERYDLASCQAVLNSVQRWRAEVKKCLSQSKVRAAMLTFGKEQCDLDSSQASLNYVQRFVEKKLKMHYCDHALSVVNPSFTFNHFDFSSETAEQNSTELDRKQELNIFYQVCAFRADRKNKMAAPASDWLILFRLLLWNRWTEFNKTWQKQDLIIFYQVCFFFGSIGKTRWPPWPLICWYIFDFSETAERNSTKLFRKQDLNVLYQICVFGLIWKTRWPPWPLIGWAIFDFSSGTTERKLMKLDRMQDYNVLYQVCIFRADLKNTMAALASDWMRHFRLLLLNRWTEFNETWQEARSQRLPSLCFSGRSEK